MTGTLRVFGGDCHRFRDGYGADIATLSNGLSLGTDGLSDRWITGPVPGQQDQGREAEGLPRGVHADGMTVGKTAGRRPLACRVQALQAAPTWRSQVGLTAPTWRKESI